MHDTMTRPATAHEPQSQQLHRVEELTDELKHLLERKNCAFDDETIHRQMDLLEHWLNCYRQNFVTLDVFTEASTSLLDDLRSRLKLAAEELQRLEGEGGNPVTAEQAQKTDEILRAIRRSEKLIANIEQLFPTIKH